MKVLIDPKEILQSANAILLVDWPNPGVPRALLAAGLKVFSFCPNRYSAAEVLMERPLDVSEKSIFGPTSEGETGYLIFRQLGSRPASVDIVNVYRPKEEFAAIVANQVLALGAKVLWLHPPVQPGAALEGRRLANEHGLVLVANADIAEVARSIERNRG